MQVERTMLMRFTRTCLRLWQQQPMQQYHQTQRQQQSVSSFSALMLSPALPLLALNTKKLQVHQQETRAIATRQHHYHHQNHHFHRQQPSHHRVAHPLQLLNGGFIHEQPSTNLCTSANLRIGKHPTESLHEPLTEDRAKELIYALTDTERTFIKTALDKYEAMRLREGYVGKLAATQWRTRFGRPSKVPRLGDVDPTGTFCAFPENWLKQRAVAQAAQPKRSDLQKIFFVNAVPFIAFGFLDNFVMIVAGDQIENLFGIFMCISTMAAAGLGNTVSDVLGIGSAYYVERGCEVIGLRLPDLSPIQMEMKSSRRSANWGRIIGITVGCLLGMSPLLFMNKYSSEGQSEKEVSRECEVPNVKKVENVGKVEAVKKSVTE